MGEGEFGPFILTHPHFMRERTWGTSAARCMFVTQSRWLYHSMVGEAICQGMLTKPPWSKCLLLGVPQISPKSTLIMPQLLLRMSSARPSNAKEVRYFGSSQSEIRVAAAISKPDSLHHWHCIRGGQRLYPARRQIVNRGRFGSSTSGGEFVTNG